ncbi:hypothetical protein H4R34_000946 [Dimargaris verticillata]|uniref:2-oxo-4-hydroxy-4-carboxy-5-ureidoimidazoline decarboxylase n=1 Tax=Dimargaris verticillata TaxID=2761393 RepID=A0A9W8B760_9FUNG|nr:hypothetical protein H4R34_000946 [Dimargaris verticillata]
MSCHVSHQDLPQLPSLDELNGCDLSTFNRTVGLFFESAPLLGERLVQCRPFASYPQILQDAERILHHDMTETEQIAVVNAHPRIGQSPTKLSVLSRAEQNGGLPVKDALAPSKKKSEASSIAKSTLDNNGDDRVVCQGDDTAVLDQLCELNQQYEAKYGFRFLVFVDGLSKAELIPVLKDRLLHSSRTTELQKALHDAIWIAGSRLRVLLPVDV